MKKDSLTFQKQREAELERVKNLPQNFATENLPEIDATLSESVNAYNERMLNFTFELENLAPISFLDSADLNRIRLSLF